jgi:hypothetical protein
VVPVEPYLPFAPASGHLLSHLSSRLGTNLVTSLAFDKCGDVEITTALLHRLTHYRDIVEADVRSWSIKSEPDAGELHIPRRR